MRFLVLIATLHIVNAGNLVTVQPAVVTYDVDPHKPALYSSPPLVQTHVATQSHTVNPYVGTYAVHAGPGVSHSYHHTQTHPVAYVKPVNVYGGQGQYYQPASSSVHQSRVILPAATSHVHQSHLVIPATNRLYQYHAYQNQPYTNDQSSFSPEAYGNGYNAGSGGGVQNNGAYPNSDLNNNGQVKTRRYQVRRPAIQKEFYDIEEKVIVRPAGSALIDFDPPISHTLQSDNPNNNYNPSQNNPHASHRGRNCPDNQGGNNIPQNRHNQHQPRTYSPPTYLPPSQNTPRKTIYSTPNPYQPTTHSTPNQYQPTTYSTPQQPSRTYKPPYEDQNQYHPTTFAPSTQNSNRQSATPESTNQDIYISSTSPVTVTIVDTADSKNSNQNQRFNNTQDITYAGESSSPRKSDNNNYSDYSTPYPYVNENNEPDQFRNELPPRGDVSRANDYRQPDQFYHELPRNSYTNPYQTPGIHVETKSNGEPTERNYYAEDFEQPSNQNYSNNNRSNNSTNDKQQRLIELYTGNGGVSEVGQTEQQSNSRYTSGGGSSYQDVGNVRARVVSATPAPDNAVPSEHVNTRRIVVSKHVETVQEVEVPDNETTSNGSDGGRTNANYNANYNDNGANNGYKNYNNNYNDASDNNDANYNGNGANAQYNAGSNNNAQYNDGSNYNNANQNGANAQYNDGSNNNAQYNDGSNYNNANQNGANAQYNAGSNNNNANRYGANAQYNDGSNYNNANQNGANAQYNDQQQNNDKNYNENSKSDSQKYTASTKPSGYYISSTPASTGQRIIYVKPVSQEFAEQKAVTPAQSRRRD